ncbi:hypothetical protein FRB94_013373 [Tulasnella sp. JGI-2019a]|nr:hypothetical protein FRB94_013373 [Tulasnella sp. JGI-2019a]KAG9006031.1 hypothetical protein FRB93_009132 [Tulasnella sp. JGI-2019a]KAG9023876.1 hypothetical protein FRB95_012385 [Tulasnella sp. JGI-2019a]
MSQTAGASTGVFYAYAKTINNDWCGRYMITFATRDVADMWYRLVSDSVAAGYGRFAAVKRVSLQFYTHDDAGGNISETLNDGRVGNSLLGQVFFTLLNNKNSRVIDPIPVLNYTDHINGESFYIRSVAQPDTYWYYDETEGTVFADRYRRSQFTINIVNKARAPGTVIIGSDEIHITSATGVNIGATNRANQLGPSANPFPFLFSSFIRKDFQIGHLEQPPVKRNPGKGERWELL